MKELINKRKEIYKRASKEYDIFLSDIKKLPKEEIIEYAYEIAVKKDILDMLETILIPDVVKTFEDIENPINIAYSEWTKGDGEYNTLIERTLENYSQKLLYKQAVDLYADAKTPTYNNCFQYAIDNNEEYLFWADNERSKVCIMHFNENAEKNYNEKNFHVFLKDWIKEFGFERCKTVLANIIQKAMHDGRYERRIKGNASIVKIPNDEYKKLYSNVHPVIINLAYKKLMDMEHEKLTPQANKSKKQSQPER